MYLGVILSVFQGLLQNKKVLARRLNHAVSAELPSDAKVMPGLSMRFIQRPMHSLVIAQFGGCFYNAGTIQMLHNSLLMTFCKFSLIRQDKLWPNADRFPALWTIPSKHDNLFSNNVIG